MAPLWQGYGYAVTGRRSLQLLVLRCYLHAMSDNLSEEDLTHMRLRIEGRVQAVGYRNFIIAEAQRLGVDGWIRNRSDGTVEALASGETKAVEALITACMRGPAGSKIDNVELHNSKAPEEKGFHRRPSV